MTPILDAEGLKARLPADTLPLNSSGELDSSRILLALQEATGVIVAHLPWLLGSDGEVSLPLPAQFAEALYGICADLALYRLSDAVSSSEDGRKRYDANLALLKTIASERQGGLLGPEYQAAEIVEPSEDEGIEDSRFFKKGEMI
jgi:phage gp36-like protein